MPDNPFHPKITKPGEEDVDKTAEFLAAISGKEDADRYRELVAGTSRSPRKPRVDLGKLAAAALASQEGLLAASFDKQTESLPSELKREYYQQVKSLSEIGFLETDEHGEKGVTGIDGKFYQLPTLQQVAAHFNAPERKAFIDRKFEQGFTRLLITPFAAPLDSFYDKARAVILEHRSGTDPSKKLLAADGSELICVQKDPFNIGSTYHRQDIEGHLVYNITKLVNSMTGGETVHGGGKTKKEILSDDHQPFPGFRVQLLQQDLVIPRKGKGTAINGRPALEAGKTGSYYLALLQNPKSPYYNEHGLFIEDWISLFATVLHETNTVIDDCADGVASLSLLIGSLRLFNDNYFPDGFWWRQRDGGIACVNGRGSDRAWDDVGVRTAVG
ncbi:MAG: hypothetical protein NT003_01230 [Candidatus Magasanikbacteria bacterium]|nr:hypothetical protein [Candidatus Magasanikbacteria bacterium]